MKLSQLFEAPPVLSDHELPLKKLTSISMDALQSRYELFAQVAQGISVYQNIDTKSFITGQPGAQDFGMYLQVQIRTEPQPVKPTQLVNPLQVSFVAVDAAAADSGWAKRTYNAIVEKHDLISDHEQHPGGKDLWNALAKQDSSANIYVYIDKNKDYKRDKDGRIVRYNGKNIDPKEIWGKSETYRTTLLVATVKTLV